MADQYSNPQCQQFVRDMDEAGMETEHYQGRWFWSGPAVRTGDDYPTLQDVIRATKVPVQWDQLGLGHIVYPIASEPSLTFDSADGSPDPVATR